MSSERPRSSVKWHSRYRSRAHRYSSGEETEGWSYYLCQSEQTKKASRERSPAASSRSAYRSRSPHRQSHQNGDSQNHRDRAQRRDEGLSRPSLYLSGNTRSESNAASDYSEGEIDTSSDETEEEYYEDYSEDEEYCKDEEYYCEDEECFYEEEDNKLHSTYQCELCGVVVNSPDQLQVHIDGQKHKKRLQRKEKGELPAQRPQNPSKKKAEGLQVDPNALTLVKCIVCKAELFNNELGPHIDCTGHKDAEKYWLRKGMELPSVRDMFVKHLQLGDSSTEVQLLDDDDNSLVCTACDVSFPSIEGREIHFNGKKHQKRMKQIERLKTPDQYYCDICNITCNSTKELNNHKRGKKHLARASWKVGVENTTPATIGKYEVTMSEWQNAY